MNYFKVNEKNIVFEYVTTYSNKEMKGYIETECDSSILGKRWNGKTFEEVPVEEVTETTEVTNEDLLEVLLAIGEKVGA